MCFMKYSFSEKVFLERSPLPSFMEIYYTEKENLEMRNELSQNFGNLTAKKIYDRELKIWYWKTSFYQTIQMWPSTSGWTRKVFTSNFTDDIGSKLAKFAYIYAVYNNAANFAPTQNQKFCHSQVSKFCREIWDSTGSQSFVFHK